MRQNRLLIICITLIICVVIICTTLIILENTKIIKNTTLNNISDYDNVKYENFSINNSDNNQSTSNVSNKKDTVNGGCIDLGGDYYQTPDGKIHKGAKYYDHPGNTDDYD